MEHLLRIDWQTMFAFDIPIVDLFIRGTIMYFFLFILLRILNRSQAGKASNSNFLLIVLIADIAQNAIAGSYNSLTSGIFLIATVFFWSYLLNWLGYKFPAIENFLYPTPIALIENGKYKRWNMRRALITEAELKSQMRIEGAKNVKEVQKAFIEGNGNISFILKHDEKPLKKQNEDIT